MADVMSSCYAGDTTQRWVVASPTRRLGTMWCHGLDRNMELNGVQLF